MTKLTDRQRAKLLECLNNIELRTTSTDCQIRTITAMLIKGWITEPDGTRMEITEQGALALGGDHYARYVNGRALLSTRCPAGADCPGHLVTAPDHDPHPLAWRVTFERVGRHRDLPDQLFAASDVGGLAMQLGDFVRGFLGSSEFTVGGDLSSGSEWLIDGGRFGRFTVTRVDV